MVWSVKVSLLATFRSNHCPTTNLRLTLQKSCIITSINCCLSFDKPINVSHNRGNSFLFFTDDLDGHHSIVVCCRVFLLSFSLLLLYICNHAHFPTDVVCLIDVSQRSRCYL